jgi:serine/threonine protein kinase
VAIKALPRQFSSDERYVELMRREERIRDIQHEAVVRYTERGITQDGHVFIVMDFIDGPSLRDEPNRRRLGVGELLVIASRVANGLQAAHLRGIIHRDLSPDNIILRSGRPEGGHHHRLRDRQGHRVLRGDHSRQWLCRETRLCRARAVRRAG